MRLNALPTGSRVRGVAWNFPEVRSGLIRLHTLAGLLAPRNRPGFHANRLEKEQLWPNKIHLNSLWKIWLALPGRLVNILPQNGIQDLCHRDIPGS